LFQFLSKEMMEKKSELIKLIQVPLYFMTMKKSVEELRSLYCWYKGGYRDSIKDAFKFSFHNQAIKTSVFF